MIMLLFIRKWVLCLVISSVILSCSTTKTIDWSKQNPEINPITATKFYSNVATYTWKERDSIAKQLILAGNIPSFLKKFVKVYTFYIDSTGKKINAFYFVAPDYLSIGTEQDWARIPLTPMAAQIIADSLHCFLPTRKMVNDIYAQAKVQLTPVPMYAFRDSAVTMWQHHLIIEGQRKGAKGLIAGIKKDVVVSGKLLREKKADRVAIYGWHQLNGKPIQPLYTGHINWWVDYSHGIRLVYRTIWVNGKPMDYTTVLQNQYLQKLLCDEEWCDCFRY